MMTFKKITLFRVPVWKSALLALIGLTPHGLLACATCFGTVDSDMGRGMTMGILVLLMVVAVVLGGILSAGLVLVARARRLGEEEDDEPQPGDSGEGRTPGRIQ